VSTWGVRSFLWGGCRSGGNPIHAVYRKHFLNPIGKTRGSEPSCLTLLRPVGYHRPDESFASVRYDTSVDKAVSCSAPGPLPACGGRPRFGAIHLARIPSRASPEGHARHRPLHMDVRCGAGVGCRDPSRAGGAHAGFSCRVVPAPWIFVHILFSARLSRSPARTCRIIPDRTSNRSRFARRATPSAQFL